MVMGFDCGSKFATPTKIYPFSKGWPLLSVKIGKEGLILIAGIIVHFL
jgi:hypothetical protein